MYQSVWNIFEQCTDSVKKFFCNLLQISQVNGCSTILNEVVKTCNTTYKNRKPF